MSRAARPSAGLFRRYLREMVLPHPGALALLGVNVALRAALGLWWPYAAKAMVDDVLVPSLAAHAPFAVQRWALLAAVGVAVLALNFRLQWLFNRLLTRLLAVVAQLTRTRLAAGLLAQSQEFYDASHAGRLLAVALQDPANLTQQLSANIVNALANVAVVLGGACILLHMSPVLALAVGAVFPLMVASFLALRAAMEEQSRVNRESWGILMGMVAEKVHAARVIRGYATEDMESAAFRARATYHAGLNVEQTRLRALYGSLNGLCLHLGYLLVFFVGGELYLRGRATLGTLVAFNGYVTSLYPAVLQVCLLPQLVSEASGSLAKVYELLDRGPTVANRAGAPRLAGRIEELRFEGVSFRYGEHGPWALRGVDLRLRAGERVGVVGPSGSGKSTLMALLLRFYDVGGGRILVNGRDARDWDLASLRGAFGLVAEDPLLFSGSLRDNLRFGRPGAPEEGIWAALADADLEGFVRAQPRGLDSPLGERGLSLSGGQRQRLALARALVASPEALILDNCTSALDAETERRVLGALSRRLEGRSAFIISHRAGAVMGCARVAVLDQGRVSDLGTPAELAGRPGYFRDIVAAQS